MKTSHPNLKYHNWLIYKANDHLLQKNAARLRGRLYDLGCGEAPYRDLFMHYAEEYVGVDWSDSYHKTEADIIADLNKPLPIESDVADTVVSLSVLEHLYNPQLMLCEAFRILKRGGGIVLQVPWQWWVHEAPYDFFRYTPYGLRHLFQEAGFVDIVVEPEAGYFTSMILKWNYFSARFVRGPVFLRWAVLAIVLPLWYVGQSLAPTLDKALDRNWELETPGYFVTARKL